MSHERKPIWTGVLDPKVEDFWRRVHDYLCQHLVCLGVRYVPINARGRPSGKEKLLRFSCFVVSLRDKWFLVTAGHALKDVAVPLEARRIRIVRSFLVDYIGHRDVVRGLTPFVYDTSHQQFVDEPTLGLDYGFIPLSELFKAGLQANGIKAISEKHWTHTQKIDIAAYAVLGFPEEVAIGYDPNPEVEDPENGTIGSVVISAEEFPDKSLLPEWLDDALKTGQWFTGRITAESTLDITRDERRTHLRTMQN